VVSLVALAHQTSDPPVRELGRKPGTDVFRPRSKEHPEDETFPGLLMIQLEGRVFFANAERIGEKMKVLVDEAKPRVVALDLSGVPDLEYTALRMLIEGEKRQRERGVSIWLVGLNPEVLSVIQRSSLGKVLGRERMHFNLELAVAKYLAAPVSESAVWYRPAGLEQGEGERWSWWEIATSSQRPHLVGHEMVNLDREPAAASLIHESCGLFNRFPAGSFPIARIGSFAQ
jgi:anti-anti-sigma factor